MIQLQKLKEKWMFESIRKFDPIGMDTLKMFQDHNNVIIPNDFKEYFKLLNGTGGECTDELYEFYSIVRIKKLFDEFKDWAGVPNYQALVDIPEINGLFVFANYSFNLFAYAIRLYANNLDINEVYILCGENYKKIANTFSEFIELYLKDSIELQLNKDES